MHVVYLVSTKRLPDIWGGLHSLVNRHSRTVASPLLPGGATRGSLPLNVEVMSLGSAQEFAVSLANGLRENFVFSVAFECQLSFSFLDSEITMRIFQPL